MDGCLNFNLECFSHVGRRPFRSGRRGWGGKKLDGCESILLTTDKLHEKLQMRRCKLLDILRSVDMAAMSRAVLSVLLIYSRFRLGSRMTWSVLGPFTCFLILCSCYRAS